MGVNHFFGSIEELSESSYKMTVTDGMNFFELGLNEQLRTTVQETIQIVVNGQLVSLDVSPIIQNARTLAPLKAIGETLGAQVQWDGKKREVLLHKPGIDILLRIGNSSASVNGKKVQLDAPPMIKDQRTMVPIRFISEAFGAEVFWDRIARTITISEQH